MLLSYYCLVYVKSHFFLQVFSDKFDNRIEAVANYTQVAQ